MGTWRRKHTAKARSAHTSIVSPLHTHCYRSPQPPSEYNPHLVLRGNIMIA